jgi:phosphatidate cytidylyltransferase
LLFQRVISAVVLAPLLIWTVIEGGLVYALVVLAASLLASYELYALVRKGGSSPLWPLGMVLSAAFVLDAYLAPGRIALPALAIFLALSLVYLVLRSEAGHAFADWSITWVVPLYAGLFLSFAVSLRALPDGMMWMFFVLGVTWATDIAAYAAGRTVGRRPFFPVISPKKTLEGAVAGVVAGWLCGVALIWGFQWDLVRYIPLIVAAPFAAEAGDLAESLIKRQLKVKDAGRLIPGHGGVLDRADSLIFVLLATFIWASLVG